MLRHDAHRGRHCDVGIIMRASYATCRPNGLDVFRHALWAYRILVMVVVVELLSGILPHFEGEYLVEGVQ